MDYYTWMTELEETIERPLEEVGTNMHLKMLFDEGFSIEEAVHWAETQ